MTTTETTSTTTTTTATTTLTPGTWRIDPGHADVGFVGRHFGLTKIRGRFTAVDGAVVVHDDLASSTVEVRIDMASVDSGDRTSDDHLRSADLFDVAEHPTGTFRSTSIDVAGSSGRMAGDLTLKGVTRPVVLDVELLGVVTDPWGGRRAVFSASTTIDRTDWGIAWNVVLDAGGLLVSTQIRIEIEVELVADPG